MAIIARNVTLSELELSKYYRVNTLFSGYSREGTPQ